MRRALAILKYVPAVLCGLLMVTWVGSLGYQVEIRSCTPSWAFRMNSFGVSRGSLFLESFYGFEDEDWIESIRVDAVPAGVTRLTNGFGALVFVPDANPAKPGEHWLGCPIPLVISVVFPLALAPFARFPLWSYFAWTAFLAVELAYYLR